MKFKLFPAVAKISLLFTVGSQFSLRAYGLSADNCHPTTQGTEICQISLTLDGKPASYKYEIKRAIPGSPTVIAIPGGPGQGLIGSLNSIKAGDFIPDDFGVITIDPRGVGKNEFGEDTKNDIYTSVNAAKDILQVIEQEKLDIYFIHGQSYGTVLATILGNLIESSNLPKARGIILSGVVADKFDDPLKGYNNQLQRILTSYAKEDQQKIIANLKVLESTFGENKRVFGILFYNALVSNVEDPTSNGITGINMKKFFDDIRVGAFDSPNQAMEVFKTTAAQVGKIRKSIDLTRKNSMAEIIKCHELTSNDSMVDLHFDFEKFELVSEISDCAKKGYVLDRPYHSADFQIKNTPIFYIQGLLDPATPLENAKLHFDRQENNNKIFIQFDNYAHTALMGLWPCNLGLWDSLGKGPTSFGQFIQSCGRPDIKVLSGSPERSVSFDQR
ncbi:MAG: alpha/beta fold hydrolase [Bdellovibrio sp.]